MISEELNGRIYPQALDRDSDEGEETNDFAQDEQLRCLRLDQWFPTADHSIPAWWH